MAVSRVIDTEFCENQNLSQYLNSALLMLLFSPHLEVHEPNENLFYSVKSSLTIKAPVTNAADDILNFFFFLFFFKEN